MGDNEKALINLPNGDDVIKAAEAADRLVDTTAKVARFIDAAFGGAISNSIGLVSDKLAYYRIEKAAKLSEKVKENLAKAGIAQDKYVPVNFGLPLIEKATIEENDDLQERWANLLANAMTTEFKGTIRKSFIFILDQLEPRDARFLDIAIEFRNGAVAANSWPKGHLFIVEGFGAALPEYREDIDIVVQNLARLGLLRLGSVPGQNGPTDGFDVTTTGLEFHRAVSKRPAS